MQSPRLADAHGMMCGRCLHLNSLTSWHIARTKQKRKRKNLRNGKGHIDMDELINFDELNKVLQEYANDAEQIYRNQLASGNKNASKSLAETATANVSVNGTTYEVVLNLQKYWKFVERGRSGFESSPSKKSSGNLPSYVPQKTRTELNMHPSRAAFPPASAILEWIKVKPVLPRPNSNGKLPTQQQLAYMIRWKIGQECIEPYPALATTIQELDALYKDKIAKALGRDVGAYIRKIIKL